VSECAEICRSTCCIGTFFGQAPIGQRPPSADVEGNIREISNTVVAIFRHFAKGVSGAQVILLFSHTAKKLVEKKQRYEFEFSELCPVAMMGWGRL
jgi:hypothetical protein